MRKDRGKKRKKKRKRKRKRKKKRKRNKENEGIGVGSEPPNIAFGFASNVPLLVLLVPFPFLFPDPLN